MAGMIIPSVIIEDGPVPAWVPDAIRRTRRRPPDTPFSWPKDTPEAVLAVRLSQDGSSPLHPHLLENSVGVMVDDDEEHGVVALSLPTLRTTAAGLAPGRHTFTAHVGADDPEGTITQPVTLDVRPGTIVVVDAQPSPSGRPEQPPAVSFQVVASGLSQRVVKDAMRKRVSKGSIAERVANTILAKVDEYEAGESDGLPRPTLYPVTPTVTVEDMPVPGWARGAIRRARRRLRQPDGILAVLVHLSTPAGELALGPWGPASYVIDGVDAGIPCVGGSERGYAVGLAAGRHSLDIKTGDDRPVQPITLDVRPGTLVLVECRPKDYDASRALPSVDVRVLPTGLVRSGRWGKRWSRLLGWTNQGGAL